MQAGGLPALEALLDDPEQEVFLEPVFAVDRTTDGIALAGEQNVTRFGLAWTWTLTSSATRPTSAACRATTPLWF